MTAKEYLREIRRMRRKVDMLADTLKELRGQATLLSGVDYSRVVVQTSPSDMMAGIVQRIIDAETDYAQAVEDLHREIRVRTAMINAMQEDYAEILDRIYIRRQPMDFAAAQMHISYDWARHLHGAALEGFGEKYAEKLNSTQNNTNPHKLVC